MVEWIIVGGGPHGCIIANALLDRGGVDSSDLRIIDPHSAPLADWNRRVHSCGMRFLRSPGAHSLAPDFGSLFSFARREGFDPELHFIRPYRRPSVELFAAHAKRVVARLEQKSIWTRGIVNAIEPAKAGYTVRIADIHRGNPRKGTFELSARNVIQRKKSELPGSSPGVFRPAWAGELIHVFDHDFSREALTPAIRPFVIGGGISAVQLALHLSRVRTHESPVTLVSLEPLVVSQFDSDPCYLGPSCMRGFLKSAKPGGRAQILSRARKPGTITPGLAQIVEEAKDAGSLIHVVDQIEAASQSAEGWELIGREGRHEGDSVVLATGFAEGPPVGDLLDRIVASCGRGRDLPRHTDGFPVPEPDLSWAPGLYVAGRLGQLELGPSAGNLIGAHNAAKRIISSTGGTLREVPEAWWRYAPASVSSSSACS